MSNKLKLSPSSAERWTSCPGSVIKNIQVKEDPSTYASDGAHTHTLLERCLNTNTFPFSVIGETLKDEYGEFIVDADRSQRATIAFTYIYERSHFLGVEIKSEVRVDPGLFVDNSNMYGTVDVHLPGATELEVIDYKDGATPVNPEKNMQLVLYALGCLSMYSYALESYRPKTIKLTIIQPKSTFEGVEPIKSVTYTYDELMGFAELLKDAGKQAQNVDAPLVSGKHCKYCPSRGNCTTLAHEGFEKIGIKPVEIFDQLRRDDTSDMSDDRLVEILENAPLVKILIDSVTQQLTKRLNQGEKINGVKLVRGRGSKKWNISEEDVVKKLLNLHIPKVNCHTRKVISPAQLRKLTWEYKGGNKSLTKAQLQRVEKNYIDTVEGKPMMVLSSDGRESLTENVESAFSSLETVIDTNNLK